MAWILPLLFFAGFGGLVRSLRQWAPGVPPSRKWLLQTGVSIGLVLLALVAAPTFVTGTLLAAGLVPISLAYGFALQEPRRESRRSLPACGFREALAKLELHEAFFAPLGILWFGWSLWFAIRSTDPALSVTLSSMGSFGLVVGMVHLRQFQTRSGWRFMDAWSRTREAAASPNEAAENQAAPNGFVADTECLLRALEKRRERAAETFSDLCRRRAAMGYRA